MKTCTTCNKTKEFSEFYKDSASRDKLTRACKDCCRLAGKKTRKKNPATKWNYARRHLQTSNGEVVTYDLFLRLLEQQRGLCGICQQEMSKPCLDHNHETNKIRMLLCHNCNIMIGMSREVPDILNRAIKYLDTYKS